MNLRLGPWYCRSQVQEPSKLRAMSSEGTIPYAGGKTWYRIVGEAEESGKLPLVCLHGGPAHLTTTRAP